MGDSEQVVDQQGAEEVGVGLTDQPAEIPSGESNPGIEQKDERGYMLHEDYTRKTQELADERRRVEDLGRQYDLASQRFNQPADQYADPEQAKLAQELSGLKQTVGNLNQVIGSLKAETLLTQINNDPKYEGIFKDKVAEELLLSKHLQMKRGDDIKRTADEIFSFVNKLKVKEKQATEKKVVENLSSPTRKAPTGAAGTGTKAPPAEVDPTKMSWRELDRMAASKF